VKLRAALSKAAKGAAKAVGYVGAGTVEFVKAPDGTFYFLEMNTRLQVEHPVTEEVYGVDLVKKQIRIAAGEKLSILQEDVQARGHAIEARVYAEDPAKNFFPSTGLIKRLVLPQGPGVRNENGIYPGYEIPIYYDPLVGKVIVWAEDRDTAIRRMRRALEEYQIDGVKTNIEFLLWIVNQEAFRDGTYDTTTIDRTFDPAAMHGSRSHAGSPARSPARSNDIDLATIAASITAYERMTRPQFSAGASTPDSAWRRIGRTEGLRKPRA
jgi:acetyl/propionyl-CoA carboxylase alpha subunit